MERPHGRRDELVSAEEADPFAAREELQHEPCGLSDRLLEGGVPVRSGPGRTRGLEMHDDLAPQLRRALLDDRSPLSRGLRPVDVARVVPGAASRSFRISAPRPFRRGSIPSSTASRASGGGKAATFGRG